MANAGPDTNGSQFFICIDDCRTKLQPLYNLFGHVTSGIDVAQAVQVGDRMQHGHDQRTKPRLNGSGSSSNRVRAGARCRRAPAGSPR